MSIATTEPTALERMLESHWCRSYAQSFSNLYFSESGAARLAHIQGFLEGLCATDKRDVAEVLAADLHRQLTYLDLYGGKEEVDERPFPRYRVMLHDDGTFGGFGVCWYRRVTEERFTEGSQKYPRNDGEDIWDYCCRVRREMRCDDKLKLWHPTHGYQHYAFDMNGALLFHGFGRNPGAVLLSMGDRQRFWSVHT